MTNQQALIELRAILLAVAYVIYRNQRAKEARRA